MDLPIELPEQNIETGLNNGASRCTDTPNIQIAIQKNILHNSHNVNRAVISDNILNILKTALV